MTETVAPTLLERMAGVVAADADPAAGRDAAPGLARALGEAAARAGARMPALDLAVEEWSCERLDMAAALGALPELALVLPLRGPGGDLGGAVIVEPVLVDALVEVQTLGRVDVVTRAPRKPTRIDATLARPFAAALISEAATRLAGDAEAPEIGPIDPSRHLVGAAQLRREIEAPLALCVQVRLTVAGGARETVLRLLLPARPAAGLPAPKGGGTGASRPAARAKAPPEDVLRTGAVRLEAVLPPVRLPLARLMALKVGDTIPLPADALSQLSLRGGRLGTGRPLPSMRGAAIRGRLGQQGGARAVKLAGPATADVPRDVAGAESGVPAGGPTTARAAAVAPPVPASKPRPVADLPAMDDLPPLDDLPSLDDLPAL